MNTKYEIKLILKSDFEFDGDEDDLIYNHLDSVKYYRLLLTLEEKFNSSFENMDISTINKINAILER